MLFCRIGLSLGLLFTLLAGCSSSALYRGRQELRRGDAQAAITHFRQAQLTEPNDPFLHRELGIAFYKGALYDSALVELGQATARRTRDGRGFFYLGATHEKKEDYDQAIQAYSRYAVVRGSRSERRLMEKRLAALQLRALRLDYQRQLAAEDTLRSVAYAKGAVAVMPFDAGRLAPELRNIGRGLAVLVMTDLGTIEGLQIVDRFRVNVLLGELKLSAQSSESAQEAPRVGKILRASTVVNGSLLPLAENLRLDAVASQTSGPPPPAIASEGDLGRLFEMEKDAVIKLAESMGLELSDELKARIRKLRVPAMDAFLEFCLGLELEAQGRYEEAAVAFKRAAKLDRAFRLAAEAAQINQDLAEGNVLTDPEVVFTPPSDRDLLGDRLGATADELNASDTSMESENTDTRLVGIGNPPGLPRP